MKMYALRDTTTGLYHRTPYEGRAAFTARPAELLTDKAHLEKRAKRLAANWIRYGYAAKPRLAVVEFEVVQVGDAVQVG